MTAKKDIDEVFKLGEAARGSLLFSRYLGKEDKKVKIVVIVSSGVAKSSVGRNKIKRVVAEVLAGELRHIPEGYRIAVTVRRYPVSAARDLILEDIRALLRRISKA